MRSNLRITLSRVAKAQATQPLMKDWAFLNVWFFWRGSQVEVYTK